MISCKVAKRAAVMDGLERTERTSKIGARSLPTVERAEIVDRAKSCQDIVLNLSVFIVLKSLWCSARDFPRCPSREARSQQDQFSVQCLIHKSADSSMEIAECGECFL